MTIHIELKRCRTYQLSRLLESILKPAQNLIYKRYKHHHTGINNPYALLQNAQLVFS